MCYIYQVLASTRLEARLAIIELYKYNTFSNSDSVLSFCPIHYSPRELIVELSYLLSPRFEKTHPGVFRLSFESDVQPATYEDATEGDETPRQRG